MSVAIVIVAAGRGRRLGGEIPKQYIPIGDRCSLCRAVEAFLDVAEVAHILPIIHPDDRELCRDALLQVDDARVLPPVDGGDTRARSVRNGLEALEDLHPTKVLVHDAARPFIPARVIADVIAALDDCDGACAALPVVDAIWRADTGFARDTVPRDGLWRAQTPQGFRFGALLDAHRTHDGNGADDVAVAREAGLDVRLVKGSEQNYKITTPDDLSRARADVEASTAELGETAHVFEVRQKKAVT